MFQLQAPRLTLRDFLEDDWPTIHALAQEPAVTRYQSVLRLTSEEEVRRWVENGIVYNNQRPREAYNLLIVESGRGRALGWIGWGNADDPAKGEYAFGYALLPEFWGRGYMTEAVRAMLNFLFEERNASRVSAYCEGANRGSARVMEKAGLVLSECLSEETEPGAAVEYRRYALRRQEWETHRAGQGQQAR